MNWTDRQRAMLATMGLRLWPTTGAADAVAADVAVADIAVADVNMEAAAAARLARPAADRSADHAVAGVQESSPPWPSATPTLLRESGTSRPTALPDAVASLDWTALRNHVAGCRACGLCENRTQTVFGVGATQAHWMVVGDAPGEPEDSAGEPFVGPAGQLLDRMLAALHLTRADGGPQPPSQRVYIANTLKCRPPRDRNPAPDELARCEPHLQRQIELLQPRIILAMGAFAVKALLRSEQPVGKLRGQVHRYHGVPLVVTFPPAYLLRSPQEKARAWDDLCLAAQVVEDAQHAGAA